MTEADSSTVDPGRRATMPRCALLLLGMLLLAACATPERPHRPLRSAQEVRAQLVTLLPADLADREGWARDIESAFTELPVTPSTENLCAVLAVAEQESGFRVDPVVPGLAGIARAEIDRRAARLHVPKIAVTAALQLETPDGRRYADALADVRSEKQLSALFDAFIARIPLGRRLFGSANPIRTGGPMQVSIAFAERWTDQHGYPYPLDGSVRDEVFSRRGSLYFGTAHLLAYRNSYQRHLYRFADFNAGWYASRNAAFQAAVTAASGTPLVLDGDLVLHERGFGDHRLGATEAAVLSLAPQLGLDAGEIRDTLEQGDRFEFEQTPLYQRVFALAEQRAGKTLPRAVLPRITLDSPKITRTLTTAWFAKRVQQRYQQCVNRAFGQ